MHQDTLAIKFILDILELSYLFFSQKEPFFRLFYMLVSNAQASYCLIEKIYILHKFLNLQYNLRIHLPYPTVRIGYVFLTLPESGSALKKVTEAATWPSTTLQPTPASWSWLSTRPPSPASTSLRSNSTTSSWTWQIKYKSLFIFFLHWFLTPVINASTHHHNNIYTSTLTTQHVLPV